MPPPRHRSGPYINQIGVSTPSRENSSSPTATIAEARPAPRGARRSGPPAAGACGARNIITHGHRQLEQPRGERRVAEHELEVLRDQEERAEHREEHEGHAAGGHAEPPIAEQAQVEHRVVGVQLPPAEEREHDGRQQERGERGGAEPAVHRALDDPVDEASRGRRSTGRRRAGRAGGCSGSRDVGRRTLPATRASTITGMFTRKTEPHQKWLEQEARTRSGRRRRRRRRCPAQMPMALARSWAGKTLVRIDRVDGMTNAAARPMRARAPITVADELAEGRHRGADEEQAEAEPAGCPCGRSGRRGRRP